MGKWNRPRSNASFRVKEQAHLPIRCVERNSIPRNWHCCTQTCHHFQTRLLIGHYTFCDVHADISDSVMYAPIAASIEADDQRTLWRRGCTPVREMSSCFVVDSLELCEFPSIVDRRLSNSWFHARIRGAFPAEETKFVLCCFRNCMPNELTDEFQGIIKHYYEHDSIRLANSSVQQNATQKRRSKNYSPNTSKIHVRSDKLSWTSKTVNESASRRHLL